MKKVDIYAGLIESEEAARILKIEDQGHLRMWVSRRVIPPSAVFKIGHGLAFDREAIVALAEKLGPPKKRTSAKAKAAALTADLESPSLLRSRSALRKKIDRTLKELGEIRERVDSTMNVAGLKREASRIVGRAARELAK